MSENEKQDLSRHKRPFYEAGWYPDLSNDEYHGSFGIGSTTLKTLADKTKAHLDYQQAHPKPPNDSMLKGSLVHSMVLEPHLTDQEYAVRPSDVIKPGANILNAKNPSAQSLEKIERWNDWLLSLGNREEVPEDMFLQAQRMAESVREHPVMSSWFDGKINGFAEQSVYYWYKSEDWDEKDDYKTMFKVRPDWLLEGVPVIFDLKTARDASYSGFMKQVRDLKYHMSAAMYLDGCNRNKELLEHIGVFAFTKFVWCVVENEPPFCATYYECSEEDLAEGRSLYHRLARKLNQYQRSEWQGYGELDENGLITPEGRVSDLPKWPYNIV